MIIYGQLLYIPLTCYERTHLEILRRVMLMLNGMEETHKMQPFRWAMRYRRDIDAISMHCTTCFSGGSPFFWS